MDAFLENRLIRTAGKLFAVIAALALISNLLVFRAAAERRKHAEFGTTLISPNHEYRIDKYYIGAGEPMLLLFKVYDRNHNLIAEHTRDVWPGAGVANWNCTPQYCLEFIYSIGEVEPIHLPPTWLDNLRARLP